MRHNAARKFELTTDQATASEAPYAIPHDVGAGRSPVHDMHARLEQAVFASFSAKQEPLLRPAGRLRTAALILGGGIGGWAMVLAAALLFR